MADVFGAVASTITLCEAATRGLGLVNDFLNAPREIAELQDQVALLSATLLDIQAASPSSALQSALLKSQAVINELNVTINTRLTQKDRHSGKFNRRGSRTNKQKINRIRDKLREAREVLSAALMAESHSQILQIESTPTSNPYCLAYNRSFGVSDPHQRLDNATAQQSLTTVEGRTSPSYTTSDSSSMLSHTRHSARAMTQQASTHSQSSQSAAPLTKSISRPASPFEKLPSFLPELYTSSSKVPMLFSYFGFQLYSTDFTRVNEYAMLYAKSPRQWVRLSVTVTLTIESHLWGAWKIQSTNPRSKSTMALPTPVVTEVAEFLRSHTSLGQDHSLSVFLGGPHAGAQRAMHSKRTVNFAHARLETKEFLQTVTRLTYYMGCARYNEKQLTSHRPLNPRRPHTRFTAFLDGRWVYQLRFGSRKDQNEFTLYNFKVLHCLRDNAEINPFLGVVVDDDTGIVNSFICELPAQGMLYHVMEEARRSEHTVSWLRRLKWCRQIVAGTFKVHSQGLVFGGFGLSPDCGVAINADDNAVLFSSFQTTYSHHEDIPGRIPVKEQANLLQLNEPVPVDMSMDIYQLGLVLWGIAVDKPSRLRCDFCEISECSMEGTLCNEPHADLNPLPMPKDDVVPEYLQSIISACREDAHQRPAAWQLLDMFPADPPGVVDYATVTRHGDSEEPDAAAESLALRTQLSSTTQRTLPTSSGDDDDWLSGFASVLVCDRCGERCDNHSYHCDICSGADYELCRQCYMKGRHCLDAEHYLVDRRDMGAFTRLVSSVRSSGAREIVDV